MSDQVPWASPEALKAVGDALTAVAAEAEATVLWARQIVPDERPTDENLADLEALCEHRAMVLDRAIRSLQAAHQGVLNRALLLAERKAARGLRG